MRLRSHLVVLVLIALLPVLVFAAVMVALFGRQEQRAIERGLLATTRALAVAVDRDVEASITTLLALATSEHLDSGDLRAFHRQLERVQPTQHGWRRAFLLDAGGRTLLPAGGAPSVADREYFRRVTRTRRPFVSDLIHDRVADEPTIVIAVPVIRGDRLLHVLGVALDLRELNRIFADQAVSPDSTGAILDRSQTIIARSRDAARFLGRRATGVLAASAAATPEGSFWDRTQEGAEAFGAYSRSRIAGWTIVLGVPADAVLATVQRAVWTAAGGGAVLLLAAVGLALLVGRRISSPIAALTASAEALGRGAAPPAPVGSTVAEVRRVGEALAAAGALLQQRQSARERAEARFRDLVDDVDAIVWESDAAASRLFFVSQRAEEKLGHPLERLQSEPGLWLGVVHPDDREEVAQQLASAAASGGHHDIEYRARAADGRVLWLRSIVSVVPGPDGRAERLRGVTVDVTQRREMDARLRLETEAIDVVNRTGQVLSAELDERKLLQTVTDAATRLAGAELGAFVDNAGGARSGAHVPVTVSGAPREALAVFSMPWAAALAGRTFRGEGVVRLDDLRRDPRSRQDAAGDPPIASYLAVPVVSRSGEIHGGLFLGHGRPGVFTEREERIVVGLAAQAAIAIDNARLYEREQRARAEAETANRLKDDFLATLSHELRTPLTAVLGWTRMLRTGQLDAAATARALEVVQRNAEAQSQLIDDLLDVSRITSGKLRLDVRAVDVADVVAAAVDSVRPAAETKGVRLQSVLDPGAGPVSGDPERLQQVVWNLLTNAIKFTPRGGLIQVRLARVGSDVTLVVSDTGQGIRPELLPHVFDRFRQADSASTRAHGGLGIGLALVKHLVEAHGGTVHADSAGPGQGATFTVRLPIMVHAAAPGGVRGALAAAAPGGGALRGVRVLVVDDDEDATEVLGHLLRADGADVRTARSAAEALRTLEQWSPDVMCSDIEMPGEDGYALIRKVRALPGERGSIPAVAVTAYGRVVDRVRALFAGFQIHVTKPVDPSELVAVVASLVGRRAAS